MPIHCNGEVVRAKTQLSPLHRCMFHLGNDEGCEADVHGHGGVVSGGGVVEGDDRAAVELVDLRLSDNV